ncbi:PAS domain-containing protein [Aestuariispira insulae]|uniref:PAS domain-containing protein n=1 Tax=Aestuariispira insulae TaxID=1461337 RepID=A0A3D9H6D2_9PROT|nr:PAS domain-containing protein [Aestuariispira insulae]RED45044.1 PAS domain-containing protein [Aestuariispira insulae]
MREPIEGDKVRFGDYHAERQDNFQMIYRYPVFDREVFHTDVVRHLYDWWSSFAPQPPQWDDFDIVQHAKFTSNIYLIKVLDQDWYEYRLNGDKVAYLVGETMQGVKFTLDDAVPSRRTLAAYCHEICESKVPRRCDGMLYLPNGQEVNFESLDCPLFNEQGEVSHTIGAIAAIHD